MENKTASAPGLIVLLGSGETSPQIRKVYDWLFEQIEQPLQTAILETPAGFQPNSYDVASEVGDYLEKHLQNYKPEISIIPARKRGTDFSTDDPDLLEAMLQANVIFMGPGSPTYAVRQLENSVTWHTLSACHRLGAALILASAGTLAISKETLPVYEIYKVGEELCWRNGLNLFEPFGLSLVFVPHWNNNDGGTALDTSRCYMGLDRYNTLVSLLKPGQTIVGIDENTALAIDLQAETGYIMGAGGMTLTRAGVETIFDSGQEFPLQELGPIRQPSPEAGIPAEIWQQVTNEINQGRESDMRQDTPPVQVIALVEKRQQARSDHNWAVADALRDDIADLGWVVLDTPEGPVLEPAQ